jgi:predicted acylesterase/phospholipase RssA
MYWLRPSYLFVPLLAPFWTTSLYDSSPLHHTLSALIDLDWLNDDKNPIHVAIAAVNVGTGNLEYFENKGDKKLSIDEIVASGSIAPALPMTKVQDPYAEKAKWFWDGAFHSNLPLSQAINLLETAKGGNPNVQRELIVVELFPMQSELPSNMLEVFDRMLELVFLSKLELDRKFFKKINSYIELFEKVDKEIPQESAIRKDVAYKELMSHKKIDSFTVITAKDVESLVGPADFSKASIERRIQAGYRDARAKLE